MRIALATDAWSPQTNGVVRTLAITVDELERTGHAVEVVHPGLFRSLPCPTYAEIRLALFPYRQLARRLAQFRPDAVHIATDGPVGQAARRWCRRNGQRFTTSYHTQFPEYVRAPRAGARRCDLRPPAAFPRRGGAHARRHALDAPAA